MCKQAEIDYDTELHYDEFIGKWIRRRRDKRASNPKVKARRKKREDRRTQKGRPPRIKIGFWKDKGKEDTPVKANPPSKPIRKIEPMQKVEPLKPKLIPMTRKEAKIHRNTNKAIQEEYKTKQEELLTKQLQLDVNQKEQEVKKTEETPPTFLEKNKWVVPVGIVGGLIGIAALARRFKAQPTPS